jgi:hypothetical protein
MRTIGRHFPPQQTVLSLQVLFFEGIKEPSVYETWIGTPVVIHVSAEQLRVPLRGTIVGENGVAVRFRVGNGWDIDVFKNMILTVEKDNWASTYDQSRRQAKTHSGPASYRPPDPRLPSP